MINKQVFIKIFIIHACVSKENFQYLYKVQKSSNQSICDWKEYYHFIQPSCQ